MMAEKSSICEVGFIQALAISPPVSCYIKQNSQGGTMQLPLPWTVQGWICDNSTQTNFKQKSQVERKTPPGIKRYAHPLQRTLVVKRTALVPLSSKPERSLPATV